MTEIFEFAKQEPAFAFLALIVVCITICALARWPFMLLNRYLRSRNIKNHGWPPPHCDADGDPVADPKKPGTKHTDGD